MIGTEPKNCDRLYLYKDNENEIYVDNSQTLKQHQVDSLRFLYRQFKNKKNGAVLNFPPGSGKSLVVTLFLNAISSLLNERVLIFCNDDEEVDHWKQLLLTWTEFKSEEVAVESSNPRLKKKIFLKKDEDINSYLRCRWGVVVVKDENMCKTLKKVVLEADLKIWITSTDVKKDVELLLFIYNWMFPKSNVNINEIISKDNPQDKMVQSIIMDTVLEDFVLRENKIKVIRDTKNSEELKLYRNNNQKGTTRKNKDATGNKIKKTKRTIDDITIEQTNNIPDVSNISTDVKGEPQPVSGNDFTEMEETTCVQDFVLKTNTEPNESNSLNLLQINQTHTVKIENITEESLDLKAENVTEESLDLKAEITTEEPLHLKTENVACVEENSTESLDFGGVEENSNSTESLDFEDVEEKLNSTESLDFGGVEKKLNSTESLDFGDEISENHDNKNALHIEDETCNHEHIKNDTKMDCDSNIVATEKSEMSYNNIDCKMSELEEKTMKKFKGSILDNLF